jgi:hypothetical protein
MVAIIAKELGSYRTNSSDPSCLVRDQFVVTARIPSALSVIRQAHQCPNTTRSTAIIANSSARYSREYR